MTRRYVCVHGHFYQPPRENPWLEAVERQDSAHPYHDWNERVTAECYAPNAASRIFDESDCIVEILDNYSRMSFNFGPTLLSWMENHTHFTYGVILEADRASRERFGGHGSAMAQAYGHLIMPLASGRDKRTQVTWGVRDFQKRFERDPEGMWLPETAVDIDTLEALAEHEIAFTVLAPHQAAAVRALTPEDDGEPEWQDVTGDNVDPSRPYLVRLPSGRSITVFFYDGPISRDVAFEGLARSGERLARRLREALPSNPDEPRLAHIATDGETFGHHQVHGELALLYALETLREQEGVELTNYASFLAEHPATWEAQIVEDSSWSCVHGIERWRSDCGCSTGGPHTWSQSWRRPLRDALNELRAEIDGRFEEAAAELLKEPWEARDDYIRVILDRNPGNVDAFLSDHALRELSDTEEVRALKLMELQRNAMYMYTSCGWFFADISGIETMQVMAYAGRVIQLAEDLFGASFESAFLDRLEEARSNIPEQENGRKIYERWVRPGRIDLSRVAGHHAIRSLFEPRSDGDENDESEIYCYRVKIEDEQVATEGRARLLFGWSRFRSVITRESARLSYAAVHLGDHTILGGVRGFQGVENERAVRSLLQDAFDRSDLAEMVRILDREYQTARNSLRHLFLDEQQKVLDRIVEASVQEAETVLEDLYQKAAPLMRFSAELGVTQPRVFQVAAESVLDKSLKGALSGPNPDFDRIEALLGEARKRGVHLDPHEIAFAARKTLESLADRVAEDPGDRDRLHALERGADLLLDLDFEVNAWGAQNTFHQVLRDFYPRQKERAAENDGEARRWVRLFSRVGEKLSIAVH
ncbi:MAG: DUF3536 domain-containing protein [Gemmatimonadota bacterium]